MAGNRFINPAEEQGFVFTGLTPLHLLSNGTSVKRQERAAFAEGTSFDNHTDNRLYVVVLSRKHQRKLMIYLRVARPNSGNVKFSDCTTKQVHIPNIPDLAKRPSLC
jgi:hypothetical protein